MDENPKLTHVAMHVEDLDACVAFYQEVCHLSIVHERGSGSDRVVWLAERGRQNEFVFVLIAGGARDEQRQGDFGHLGFAVRSREEVDEIAERARGAGRLVWPPRDEPYPVGYYCGLRDPNGRMVEVSYGQPLGPGAPRS
jgi:catechol 2,3-dioxygenase-like lactoylglutathione lyase family enzyme